MTDTKIVKVGDLEIANDKPFTLIAGPCAMQSRDHALFMAAALKEICERIGLGLIFKTSFDKANRTSVDSGRGIGLDKALSVFAEIKETLGLPVITDVHTAEQCAPVAEVVDVLQTPSFLCRQTDLILAAARTGAALNLKKGQFLAPWEMKNVAAKAASTGNERIMLCDRGTSFGYNTLVSDFRGLPCMAETGYPVIFDATHSVQQPGGLGETSGGQREYVPVLARAAVAVGVAGVFMEIHDDPMTSPSDGANMIPLDEAEAVLKRLMAFDDVAKG